MQMRKLSVVLIYFTLIGVGIGAAILFNIRGTVEVFESDVTISPQSFSIDVAKGVEYVKQITIKNSGTEKCVYFEEVIEGPSPEKIDVSYKDVQGNSVYSSKKLCLPQGTKDVPSETKVNVHIDVRSDAETGKHLIYIFVRT
ncbi:MAG: hypothetical protein QXN34_00755 [Archaeoglobaceae archaeon]